MKLAVLTLLAGSAAAFAPSAQTGVVSSLSASDNPFAGELGAQPPLGFFDPLGLVASGDQAKFERLRFVELKHGRISQLAFLGYLATWSGYRLPGDINLEGTKFTDIGAGFNSLSDIGQSGIVQIVGFIGACEVGLWKQKEGSFPGDFSGSAVPVGFLGRKSEEDQYKLRAAELNQGRAAMMGILGVMVHEQLDGNPFIFFDGFAHVR